MNINLRCTLGLLFFTSLLFGCAGGPQPKPSQTAEILNQTGERTPQDMHQLNDLQQAQLKTAVDQLNQKNLDTAKKSLKQLNAKAPANSLVLSNLSVIALYESKLAEAGELIEKSLRINPDNAHAHNILGLIKVETGDINSAEQAYIKALNIDSNYSNAHYNLALIYDIYYQDLKRAIQHYQAYLALSDFQDKQTLEWVQELERSLEKQ